MLKLKMLQNKDCKVTILIMSAYLLFNEYIKYLPNYISVRYCHFVIYTEPPVYAKNVILPATTIIRVMQALVKPITSYYGLTIMNEVRNANSSVLPHVKQTQYLPLLQLLHIFG